jgi:hypothetical protein
VRFPVLLILLFSSSFALANQAAATPDQGRSRLLELFIWKTSEELKLPTDVEAKFGETVRHLNERRKANTERMEKAIQRLDELTRAQQEPVAAASPAASPTSTPKSDAKAIDAALAENRKSLQEYQKLQNDELAQLKVILTPEKLARYFVVKSELTEKLKTFLSKPNDPSASPSPGGKDVKPLGTPKVIEEK